MGNTQTQSTLYAKVVKPASSGESPVYGNPKGMLTTLDPSINNLKDLILKAVERYGPLPHLTRLNSKGQYVHTTFDQ